ncbi:MAG: DUF488 domain-containing protein [Bacteroidetes Order II. Incertae sedis bacterium]|nr:DUF488 domain-containing protein [Bacteroidetes Order II. bacterium]
MNLFTIGVYGFTEKTFFETLKTHEIDVLVDVRRRRGVRGKVFAFANRVRLESQLAKEGMAYLYLPELAPTDEIRALATHVDASVGVTKRTRQVLPESFCLAYQDQVLSPLSRADVRLKLPPQATRVALLCVEANPHACHRQLAAAWLSEPNEVPVKHLIPTS